MSGDTETRLTTRIPIDLTAIFELHELGIEGQFWDRNGNESRRLGLDIHVGFNLERVSTNEPTDSGRAYLGKPAFNSHDTEANRGTEDNEPDGQEDIDPGRPV